MSLSAAYYSILALHAFLLLSLVVFAAMVSSIPAVELEHEHGGDVNTTTTTLFTNSSSEEASYYPSDNKEENWETYLCFLCSGRDPLLIHHCPIYWDECHMICWDDTASAAAAAAAIPAAMAATAPPRPAAVVSSSDHDDCYVMKLYMSGRYVIVEHRPCKYIGECFLTCGGGELAAADRQKVVMGGTATTATTVSAATTQGSFLPVGVELCGTQQVNINAPPSSAAGGVFVPAAAAAGAHRRRR